jgi:parallel beta-helix repeat protein
MNRLCATFATLSTLPLLVSGARAADIWVDAGYTGSTSTGSTTQPFKKIGDTYAAIQPGDTVRVRPGTYYEGVWIKSGSSNALRVTYKSEVKWGAKIVTPASTNNGGCFQYWGGNTIDNVSTPSVWGMTEANGHKIEPCGWVTIDGFDLHSDKKDSTGAGTWFQWVHHITIRNCWSHDNAMAGLGASLADYIIIENNIVNDNSVGSGLGNDTLFSSGISNWKVRPWDTNSGFHNIIRGNVVFNNHNDLTNPSRSDGNGIILDTTAFDTGTLVENNLIVNNGGVGILLDGSSNCTVRYNTLYQNCWDGTAPEIYVQKVTWEPGGTQNQENAVCKNSQIYGNIVVARTNRLAVKANSDNINNSVHHNLRWFSGQSAPTNVPAFYGNDGNLSDTTGVGDITGQDPQFVNSSTNTWASDFHLQHYSPAINKNTVNTANSKDLDGQTRSGTGAFVDLGGTGQLHRAVLVLGERRDVLHRYQQRQAACRSAKCGNLGAIRAGALECGSPDSRRPESQHNVYSHCLGLGRDSDHRDERLPGSSNHDGNGSWLTDNHAPDQRVRQVHLYVQYRCPLDTGSFHRVQLSCQSKLGISSR